MRRAMTAAVLGLASAAVHAQPAAAPVVVTPDPARLAAARQLAEVAMPPELREKWIEQSVAPATAMTRVLMINTRQVATALDKDPRVRPILDRYMARLNDETHTIMREASLEVPDVTARYYAERLTVAEINTARDFYATPAGKAFAIAAAGLTSDPAYAAIARKAVVQLMPRIQEHLEAMGAEIDALGPAGSQK